MSYFLEQPATALLVLGVVFQCSLLGANLFEAVVDVPNWKHPGGVSAYRAFIQVRNAGHFYRVLSPLTIVLLLAALTLGWSGAERNLLVGIAAVAAIGAEVFTVAYFFPRNEKLFLVQESPPPDSEQLVKQWGRANLVRCMMVSVGVFSGILALASGST